MLTVSLEDNGSVQQSLDNIQNFVRVTPKILTRTSILSTNDILIISINRVFYTKNGPKKKFLNYTISTSSQYFTKK